MSLIFSLLFCVASLNEQGCREGRRAEVQLDWIPNMENSEGSPRDKRRTKRTAIVRGVELNAATVDREERSASEHPTPQNGDGAYFKDVFLPDGTELRATHKGKTYFARISGSAWIDQATGMRRSSPSQAAYFITNNHVNGWLFWLVRRPGDEVWHSLNALRARQP